MFQQFYMVYRRGGSSPTVTHLSQEAAEQEAERLARLNRGDVFTVLEAVSEVRVNDVSWDREPSDTPF